MTAIKRIRLALDQGSAWQALDLALAAAREAGVKALTDNPRLTAGDQLGVALQAADEALEGLAVALSEEGPEAEAS